MLGQTAGTYNLKTRGVSTPSPGIPEMIVVYGIKIEVVTVGVASAHVYWERAGPITHDLIPVRTTDIEIQFPQAYGLQDAIGDNNEGNSSDLKLTVGAGAEVNVWAYGIMVPVKV